MKTVKDGVKAKDRYMDALAGERFHFAVDGVDNNTKPCIDATSKPTANQLRVATQALKEWKDFEELYGGKAKVEFNKLQDQLDACWEQLGFTRQMDKGERWFCFLRT